MPKTIIAGNWKMNKTVSEALDLAQGLKNELAGVSQCEILVCPPYTALFSLSKALAGSNIKLGAQDMHWEQSGAFTGEVSGPMLKEVGSEYVIIGHSERRQYFGETNQTVNKKLQAVLKAGLIPLVCVGETLAGRENNQTFSIVETQLKEGLKGLDKNISSCLVLAYEPIWAIGTGKTATPEQAEEVHKFIRQVLKDLVTPDDSLKIPILYGGSVKPENIRGLMIQENIDGALVGGASLKKDSFVQIVKNAVEVGIR